MTNVQRNRILISETNGGVERAHLDAISLKFKEMNVEKLPSVNDLEQVLRTDARDVAVVITDHDLLIAEYSGANGFKNIAFVHSYSGDATSVRSTTQSRAFTILKKPYSVFLLNGVIEKAKKAYGLRWGSTK